MSEQERPPEPSTHREQSATGHDRLSHSVERKAIGEYQLIRKIGGGGMGVVYEALHSRLKRRVALKLIAESYLAKPGAAKRFFREMEAAGRLEHPHIVQATDAGVVDGVPYLVMEFVQGSNLSRIVRQYGPLPPLAALEAIEQAAKALGHIHAHGMVHRDIKPSNLLLSERGQLKVADLGLAQLLRPMTEEDEVTVTGDVVGTADYMAPEQAQNAKLIDHRADIYSLGCCMHFLFCGGPVFRAESHIDRLIAHRLADVPELSFSCGFPLPASLNYLFREMLAKDPDKRPAAIADVLKRLQACRIDLRHELARPTKRNPRQVGEKSLAIDAGLEATARNLLADGFVTDDESLFKSTVLIRHSGQQAWKRYLVLGACTALAILIVAFASSPLASLLFGHRPAHVMRGPSQPGNNQPGEKDLAGPVATVAPLNQVVLDAHPGGAVFGVRFCPDGQHVVSCGSDGLVRVWELETRRRTSEMNHERGPNGVEVIAVAMNPESEFAVSVCYNGIATVWNWKQGTKHLLFDQHRNQVEGIAWIRGSRVLTTGRDDAMYIWDVNTGDVVARLDNSHTGGVRAVAVDPEGRRAVTADYSGTVLLWDLQPGKEQLLASLQPVSESNAVWCIDWVAGTNQVALGGVYASGESLLMTYDIDKRQVVRKYSQLSGRVFGLRVARDGKYLFSAADAVHGWSLESDQPKPLFEYTGHDDNAFSVDESPDGTKLVTGGTDGTVRIFSWRDLMTRRGDSGSLHPGAGN